MELHNLAKKHVQQLKEELEENPGILDDRYKANKQRATRDRLDKLNRAQEEFKKYSEQSDVIRKKHKKKLLTDREKQAMRVSTTDPEARVMKMADGGFRPAYNFQFAVDTKNNIVIGAKVVNAGTDGGQMLPMYETIKAKLGKIPSRYLADGGFKSKVDIEQMTRDGCKVFMPVQENSKKGKVKNAHEPKAGESEAIGEWRKRMNQEDSRKVYKKRATTIELANANFRGWDLHQVTLRGLAKVTGIACMFAVVYNTMKTISLGLV